MKRIDRICFVRRSELLALTGITAARFGNIFHRGQLPFGDPNAERQGWADYSLDEAVQLALMLRLMELNWPIERATAAVREHFELLVRARDRKKPARRDLHFGVFQETLYLPDDWSVPVDWFFEGFAGTLAELDDDTDEPSGVDISGMVLVNASATVRRMIHTGRAKGAKPETLKKLRKLWRIRVDV
jgi:hypothetical protein